jgi:hypothetical protein
MWPRTTRELGGHRAHILIESRHALDTATCHKSQRHKRRSDVRHAPRSCLGPRNGDRRVRSVDPVHICDQVVDFADDSVFLPGGSGLFHAYSADATNAFLTRRTQKGTVRPPSIAASGGRRAAGVKAEARLRGAACGEP